MLIIFKKVQLQFVKRVYPLGTIAICKTQFLNFAFKKGLF